MDEQRLGRIGHQPGKALGLRNHGTCDEDMGKSISVMPALAAARDLLAVPAGALLVAQIDDRLDTVGIGMGGDVRAGRLGRAVEFAGYDFVKISGELADACMADDQRDHAQRKADGPFQNYKISSRHAFTSMVALHGCASRTCRYGDPGSADHRGSSECASSSTKRERMAPAEKCRVDVAVAWAKTCWWQTALANLSERIERR